MALAPNYPDHPDPIQLLEYPDADKLMTAVTAMPWPTGQSDLPDHLDHPDHEQKESSVLLCQGSSERIRMTTMMRTTVKVNTDGVYLVGTLGRPPAAKSIKPQSSPISLLIQADNEWL